MTIMIFLQGTLIVHSHSVGKTREEMIQQVLEQETSVRDFAHYIPVGQAVVKLQTWAAQGANICYLSALTQNKRARGDELVGQAGLLADEIVLLRHGFPAGTIYHREPGENYCDVVARATPLPDILIEDDCLSIGGAPEMIYPTLSPTLKAQIKSIAVREFGGVDHLADDIFELLN